MTEASPPKSAQQLAMQNWSMYESARQRGHADYIQHAKRLEQYYLGGGLQWTAEDRAVIEAQRRPCIEINAIFPAVNTAVGHQIHNRMDIAFKPRGGEADDALAEVLSKVAMQVADRNKLHWTETQVMTDGLVQQRGYYDIRVNTESNISGSIKIDCLDPLDVIPDPDARDYDPDRWKWVLIVRWLNYDEVEQLYGPEARKKIEYCGEDDRFSSHIVDMEARNRFGSEALNAHDPDGVTPPLVAIIERQESRMALTDVLVSPNGDVVPLTDKADPASYADKLQQGYMKTRRVTRRVRWIVTARSKVLFDEWSPYPFFTVVPYFPFFRRGVTRGLVDNATSPQDLLNKSVSQQLHVINTTANSGWIVEQNSLANMTEAQLADQGASTGLNLVVRQGSTPPQKIQPNAVPPGLDRMVSMGMEFVKSTTGVNDALQGQDSQEVSGIAIQSKQFMGLTGLSMPLDNLNRSRTLLAQRMLWLIQQYYTDERILTITDQDDHGNEVSKPLAINQFDPIRQVIDNDVTVGEYDVVITEQPSQVTFGQSQLMQALELRKAGVQIPDDVLITHTTLSKKRDILARMQQTPPPDPLRDAEIALKQAQTDKISAEATNKRVESQYSAIQTAQTIATVPGVAPLADTMLKSAGYQDMDLPPIVPEPEAGMAPEQIQMAQDQMADTGMPTNTNPLTPANPVSPSAGMNQGIETMRNDGGVDDY
jgi:hypothetical protein